MSVTQNENPEAETVSEQAGCATSNSGSQGAWPSELRLIEASKVSTKMKANLRLVHANLEKSKFGFPVYKKQNTQMETMKMNFKLFSVWAFIFNALYYFVKGMWRKGLLLLALVVAFTFIGIGLDLVFLVNIVSLLVSIIAGNCAYFDMYRTIAKKEKFWW